MATRQARVYEWLLVATVIGVIWALAASFYARMANDVHRLSFELTAEHYKTAVAAVRAHYYVHRGSPALAEGVDLYSDLPGFRTNPERPEGQPERVYLNQRGWPASTRSHGDARDGVSSAECQRLWEALLEQAPPVAVASEEPLEADYRASVTEQGSCRYERVTGPWEGRYFDYSPATGTIRVNSAEKVGNSAD